MKSLNLKNIASYISGVLYVVASVYATGAASFGLPRAKEIVEISLLAGLLVSGVNKLFTTGGIIDKDGNGIPDSVEGK